jgi:hypothetical protein
MCSGKRQGRAKLRQNVAGLAKNQDDVYEYYQNLPKVKLPGIKRGGLIVPKPNLHPGWKVYLAKPKRKRRAPEAAFQCQVAQYLAWALPKGYWFTAFPAGGGGRIRGARLKAMGLKAGVPDVVVFGLGLTQEQRSIYCERPTVLWLELKAKTGSLSPAQRDVHKKLKNLGHRVETVKTLEQVETALAEFVFPEKLQCSLS